MTTDQPVSIMGREPRRRPALTAASLLVAGLLAAACTATPKYVALGEAGVAYGGAMDSALLLSAERRIDLNSVVLLTANARMWRPGAPPPSPAAQAELRQNLADADAEAREVVADTTAARQLVAVFTEYFAALQALASSAAPEETAKRADAVGRKLAEVTAQVGAKIDATGLGTVAGGIARIVVAAQVNAALRRELEARKETIFRALALQTAMLDRQRAIISRADERLAAHRAQEAVVGPLMSGRVANTEGWVEARRRIVMAPGVIFALSEAKAASERFAERLAAALAGTMDLEDFRFLAAELTQLKDVIDAARGLSVEIVR